MYDLKMQMNIVVTLLCIFVVLQHQTEALSGLRRRRVRRGWLQGGTSAARRGSQPVTCAFNPCSVAGFCGEGRTCHMDANCMHRCECTDDSTHVKCVSTDKTTTPRPITCTFDPCASAAFTCTGDRKCVLNSVCMPECHCTSESTHPSCIDDYEGTTALTTTTSTERPTCNDDICKYGKCAPDMTCACDLGWSGSTCNVALCTKQCKDGLQCHYVSEIMQICMYTHKKESTSLPPDQSETSDVCNLSYELRNSAERVCKTGTVCKYGKCASDKDDDVICKCDVNAYGDTCNSTCCRDCGNNATCSWNEDVGAVCECKSNYTGDNCTDYEEHFYEASTEPHKDPRWVYWVAGVCGFLLVALVILLVIMPYFLWRKRVILVMKLVHYFQGYEDDDDSKWDAFISYKSNTPDEDFVVHTLFPKLARELGFSVNVHFKDFTPGEDITNNIIHAVENSRRTILIVSPNYLASNFAKFEWQTAQQRMLERRHRIIPILLEDVSSYRESMDPNLRQILDSVTYIEWPHDENTTQKKTDKFWKRIELSMPKKKQKSTASPNEYSKDTPTDNTTATFVKPDSVELTVVNGEEISRPPYLHEDSGIYCSINENERPNPEEVYNTINEADIEAKSQGKEHTKNNSNDAYYITPKHTQIAESSNNLENQLTKENLDEREMKFLKILEVDV
ncbi:uncharacterized protein LOC128214068 isoform X2 [Mya arenaria]|uniref:uncharacterized protein LOC128214068 isoform X2 n=1 Tax=Mya arenaria TaxID=6604 RepID=UPI0022E7590A|nr:uncharacterized protein LOC128214068 isoform X2 [Mya arenaria]